MSCGASFPARRRAGRGGIAWTPDLGGTATIAREVREICEAAARRLERLGMVVEEASPDMGEIGEAFQILRALIFAVNRGPLMETHRDQLNPDIIWNTEKGLNLTAAEIAWAERERAAFYQRMISFFETYDLLLCPCAATPAFDVNLRYVAEVDGKTFDNYIAGSLITSAITLSASPALSLPAGFTGDGRPVGLQMVGKPHGEADLLAAAALLEEDLGLARHLPIDPRVAVPPPGGDTTPSQG